MIAPFLVPSIIAILLVAVIFARNKIIGKLGKNKFILILVTLSALLLAVILYFCSIPHLLPFSLLFLIISAGSLYDDDSKQKTRAESEDSKKLFFSRAYGINEMLSVDEMTGIEFEQWCAKLLKNRGYQNVITTKASNDQGVDIVAEKDGIRYAIQCKRYSHNLGNTPIQEVYAGMVMYNCSVGMVMTNQYFSSGAIELARKTGVQLADRNFLIDMIEESNKINENFNLAFSEMEKSEHTQKRKGRKKKMKKLKPSEMWPHRDVTEIDIAYFKAMPTVTRTGDMKNCITAYPLEPNVDPHTLPVDQIITIISELFDRKDHAEHFAKAVSKHCCSIAEVIENAGKYNVKIRAHVYNIMSNYFEHGEDTEPTYKFANWS